MPATKQRNGTSKARKPETTVDAHETTKKHLHASEIDRLLKAAKEGRHGVRDHLILLMMYRHGLRVSEATGMMIKHVNMTESKVWVQRLKGSLSTDHPIAGDELRAIKRYLATRDDKLPWLFLSERGGPLVRHAVGHIIKAAGARCGLPDVHPHMLRHSCGYYLANSGQDLRLIQDYLGHRDVNHTAHYTKLADHRFQGLWKA